MTAARIGLHDPPNWDAEYERMLGMVCDNNPDVDRDGDVVMSARWLAWLCEGWWRAGRDPEEALREMRQGSDA